MSLLNVDNVVSGLGSYGVDSDRIYADLNNMCNGETEKALESYLTREPSKADFNSDNAAVTFEVKYPGS